MSPLARSFLALALAGAALLRPSCAHTMCSIDETGQTYKGNQITLPLIVVKESGDFDIPNNCKAKHMILHGELAMVCDWFHRPYVKVTDDGASVRVTRALPTVPEATLLVRQYCNVTA